MIVIYYLLLSHVLTTAIFCICVGLREEAKILYNITKRVKFSFLSNKNYKRPQYFERNKD